MIFQQRLISRSSRSLAVMIGFAQPAGSRSTWRSDGDIDSGYRRSPCNHYLALFPNSFLPRSSSLSRSAANVLFSGG
jgi:hypothetical protein